MADVHIVRDVTQAYGAAWPDALGAVREIFAAGFHGVRFVGGHAIRFPNGAPDRNDHLNSQIATPAATANSGSPNTSSSTRMVVMPG